MTASDGLASTLAIMCFGTMLGCGSTPRRITSLTINPAVADAQSYPTGQVQYSAIANYNHSPSAGPIEPALWAIKATGNVQGTISQSGVAQCSAGAAGTFIVIAWAIADPQIPQTNHNLLNAKKVAVGIAQLNCP
jgi:hypothetical protein